MEKKKILLAYASYGSGHKSAAKYIQSYFESQKNDYIIKIIDLSDYNSLLGKIGEGLFNLNLNHNQKASLIFSIFYKLFDYKISSLPYNRVTNDLYNQKLLIDIIKEFNPDLTISTHFFASTLIAKYNKEGYINSKLITVLTDYRSHEFWMKNFKNEDALIVGNEIIKRELVNKGYNKNKIYPFGIPLSEKFMNAKLIKESTYLNYNLKKDLPIISFLNGSAGSIVSYEYLKSFLKKRYNVQVIMFCGKNEKVKLKCEELISENKYKNVLILPFTNDVNNLINISDLVVTKPGGLSITECLELKKPMMLIPGAGGPENYNARFLVAKGVAINNKNIIKFKKNMKKIIKNPNILQNMVNNLNKYERNTSVIKLYKLSQKLLNKK